MTTSSVAPTATAGPTATAVPTATAGQPGNPAVSVCIVTHSRARLLDSCLRSLQEQESPPPFELLVGCVVKGSGEPDVRGIVRSRFPEATVGGIQGGYPGAARNLIVERARGELLLFVDDDVICEPTLLRRVVALASAHPEVGVFGGPNLTPPGSTRFQVIQGAVLGSALAAGPIRRRYGKHAAGAANERQLILCNLAIRRSVMVPFANHLACAEENGLLAELSRQGVRMHYDPDLVVFHERRPSPGGFIRQMLKYGRGRGQLMARVPRSSSPVHLAPVALLAYLVLLPLAIALFAGHPLWMAGALAPLALYLMAVAASGLNIARNVGRWRSAPVAGAMTVAIHLAYGAGIPWGLTSSRRSRPAPEWSDRPASRLEEA
ncbi:MAG: glycosyltransferase [Actinomycetota bacterium]